ncbi:MAG: fibronectin type III domain-containing protein, partial [Candidatus Firestonebacteria bacterium]|nr:fibronectin type III domain-containing protein [Candidatus Firestonebacteria bacterium]
MNRNKLLVVLLVFFMFILAFACGGSNSGSSTSSPILSSPAPDCILATSGDKEITLVWSAVAGSTSYNLYYNIGNTVTKSDSTIKNISSPYVVKELKNNTQYSFALTSVNISGESKLSSIISAIPVPMYLFPPFSLYATEENEQVTLYWDKVAGASSYNLYYDVGNVTNKTDYSILNVESPFTVTGLINNNIYTFAVTSINEDTESDLSLPISATPNSVFLFQPTGLKAISGKGCITLNWNAIGGATSYKIYYSEDSTLTKIDSTITSKFSPYTIEGLTNNKKYTFAVSSVNKYSESKLSKSVTAVPSLLNNP